MASPGTAAAAALATTVEAAAPPVPTRRAQEERTSRVFPSEPAVGSCFPFELAARHPSLRALATADGLLGARELGSGPRTGRTGALQNKEAIAAIGLRA